MQVDSKLDAIVRALGQQQQQQQLPRAKPDDDIRLAWNDKLPRAKPDDDRRLDQIDKRTHKIAEQLGVTLVL